MKYFLPALILLTLLLGACQDAKPDEWAVPESLDEKKRLLKEKRAEIKQLQNRITELESAIAEQDPNQERGRELVTTLPLERRDFRRYVDIQGAVEAEELIDVTSEMTGRIVQLHLQEGAPVKKGQLVAELDLEQVEKQVAELETSLELATTVYERRKRLWNQNIGSEIQYLEAKNSKERIEKSLETLKVQLRKSKVYAPASGVVEAVPLQTGELAIPGAPIIQILDTYRLKVVADVPENYLTSVQRGERVRVGFPALDIEREAPVTLIGRTIDPSNRTFRVEVKMLNRSGLLKPNLLATMSIKDFEATDAVVIPLNLVQQEVSGKKYVFIQAEGPDGSYAKKTYVTTGPSSEGEIIITSGLDGSETLIDEGARGLTDGALIQVKSSKPISKHG